MGKTAIIKDFRMYLSFFSIVAECGVMMRGRPEIDDGLHINSLNVGQVLL